jgi:hypothetical protein
MDIFIAAKPVRFGKNYGVGEIIPESVVDPRAIARLIGWGKIQRVTMPDKEIEDAERTPLYVAETPQDASEVNDRNFLQGEDKTPQDGLEDVAGEPLATGAAPQEFLETGETKIKKTSPKSKGAAL